MRLVELTGARYHARPDLARGCARHPQRASDAGLPVTCGVSTNHLTFNENDVGAYHTFLQGAPPLRSEDDRAAMVEGVASGLIDVIVSSHEPQGADTKRQPFAEAAAGTVGLETLLPAALRLIHDGEMDMDDADPRDDDAAGRAARPARRHAGQGRARRPGGARRRRALVWIARTAIAVQEHAFERPLPGRVHGDHRGRRLVYRARLTVKDVRRHDSLNGIVDVCPIPLALVLGYLLGSIPFGLFFTRLVGRGDVRTIGSGNIGATNVLRTGRKGLAAATLILRRAEGHRGRAHRRLSRRTGCCDAGWPRRVSRPSVPGLAEISRRQGCRRLYRHPDRPALAGGDPVLR